MGCARAWQVMRVCFSAHFERLERLHEVAELLLGMNAQFGVDALGVGAHGVLGHAELLGDARHRVATRDVLHDLSLAVGEPEG